MFLRFILWQKFAIDIRPMKFTVEMVFKTSGN